MHWTQWLIFNFDEMRKFSKEDIIKLFGDAPVIAPELIEEFYDALNTGGVDGVNELFRTKGTFDPNFKDKKAVIDYIVLMKQFSGMELTLEEQVIADLNKNKN
tara:strand:+ start:308 stop:616 length:309 start_codon:yes stop_codon:yes gene_type:complete